MEYFKSQGFGSHVKELMRQNHVPGFSIAVVQDDETATAAFGSASLDPEEPCTPDTLFDIASVSKSMTAACVAFLVNDNNAYPEVRYDAIMSRLLPGDFVLADETYTDGVTVDDVLGHRTGMPGHNDSLMGLNASHPDNAGSVTRNLRNLPLAAPLRSRYLYCNMMYTAATHLVEVKTGESFDDFLHDRIFHSLGMKSTNLQPSRARAKGLGGRMAAGYVWNKASSSFKGFSCPDCPEGQGAGSVISSANDMALWVKALVNREDPTTEQVYQDLVRMRSFRDPNGRRLKPRTSPGFYGAGVETYYYRGYAIVFHDGNVAGFASRFFLVPEIGFGAVMMGNSGGAVGVIGVLVRELLDEALKIPPEDRQTPRRANKPTKPKTKKAGTEPKQPKAHSNLSGVMSSQSEAKRLQEDVSQERMAENLNNCRLSKSQQETYTGVYHHPGYRTMTVGVNNNQLFINATDRSTGFTLTLEPGSTPTKFTGHLCDALEGGDDLLDAEFILQGDVATKMGLDLEPAMRHLIWFDKVEPAKD